MTESSETPGSNPSHPDGDTEAPEGKDSIQGHTVNLVPSWPLPPTVVITMHSRLPPAPTTPPGSPSSSWFRVFHSMVTGAAPSWMRHLKLASWPCRTVLLGGSMEMTGLLRPGEQGGQRAGLSRAGMAQLPTRDQVSPSPPATATATLTVGGPCTGWDSDCEGGFLFRACTGNHAAHVFAGIGRGDVVEPQLRAVGLSE